MPGKKNDLGERLKALRTQKKLSVEEVSRKSGLPVSLVSGIETNDLAPPLGNIISLANALQVPVGELFGDSADSPFCIVRSDNRETVARFDSAVATTSNYCYESLGHQKQNRHMEPFLVTLTPAAGAKSEPNQHAGEEILFVLSGHVEVSLANHTDILHPGDSIYFDSSLPHRVACHGQEPASLFAVIYTEQEMEIF